MLFEPMRYKVVRGGRGSGKSWAMIRALVLQGAQREMRILCAREIQKSLKESVHQLISDQIKALGLESFYEVQNDRIIGANGTTFHFVGLQQHTVTSIKSFENCSVCFVEEGQTVSKKSWDILVPTIRAPNSEIWVAFNPELDTDETYRRFVLNAPDNCVSLEVNHSQNPFFPAVLEIERLHALKTMPQADYDHIWEGKCKPAVEGAIYFNEMARANIGPTPHDGNLKTHVVWDLGFADSMALILAQKVGSEVRVVHYIEGQQRTLSDYVAELNGLELDGQKVQFGTHYLPHDGFHRKHQTGKADAEVLQGLGLTVERVPTLPTVDAGINRTRELFPRLYFNRERTQRLLECCRRYRRKVDTNGVVGAPLHDEYSHGADALRYLAQSADQFTNEQWSGGASLAYRNIHFV